MGASWGRWGSMQCSLSVMCVRAAGSPRCSGFTFSQIGGMMWAMANVRMIKHEVIPDCESFEVRYPDGRPPQGSSQRWNVSAMAALGLASRLSQSPCLRGSRIPCNCAYIP